MGNLARLALPLAGTMALHMIYSAVDAFWLGHYSKEALAATGACLPFLFVVISFGMGFGQAGAALVAQYTGAENHMKAGRAAGQMFILLCGLAVLLAVPLFSFAPQVLKLAQVPENVVPPATGFLRVLLFGLPIMSFSMGYGSALRAIGNTTIVLLIGVVTNVINLALDPLLIFGVGFFPEMGVKGAAVATVFARLINAFICVYGLSKGWAGLRLHWSNFRPDRFLMRKTLSVGFPAAIGNSSNSVGFAVFQVMINSLGTTVIGGMVIGIRVLHFFNIPAQAMAMAAAPVVGQNLGAGKKELARRGVELSARFVAGVMLIPMILLVTQGHYVGQLFTDNVEIIKEATKFFRIVPASSYCFGVLMVLLAAFYGSGHTRPAMFVHIVRLWILRLPLAYTLGYILGFGSRGIYFGMVAGNIISAVMTYGLFRLGKWESAVVGGELQSEKEKK